MIELKFRSKNNSALALIIGFVLLYSMTAITQYTQAIDNTNTSQFMNLGNPFLVEHYETMAGKPETIDNSITSSFPGEGLINGTVNTTASGNGTETFRNNDTSYIQGKSKYVTDDKDIPTCFMRLAIITQTVVLIATE